MKTAVLDYGAGNLRSVETALRHLGKDFLTTSVPDELGEHDALIIPGVGEAKAAMARLEAASLVEPIREFFRSGKRIVGICLGSQIVLDASEEGSADCLGLVPGRAKAFGSTTGLKIPHMGWNTVGHARDSALWHGIPDEASFYFVHSFYPAPEAAEIIIGTTEYGVRFASAIEHENLVAFQFHPEKSGRHGLRLLSNLLSDNYQGR